VSAALIGVLMGSAPAWAGDATPAATDASPAATDASPAAIEATPGSATPIHGVPERPPKRLRFEPSGLKGGGFFTSVAIAPGDSDTIVLAGGNSGYHRSTDLGARFEARNRDLLTLESMRIASVAFHPTRPSVLFGVSGNRGENGGVARSLDHGLTWEVISTEPHFAGQDNSSIADLPEHPRSTGSLIAIHDDTIWVGTFDQGVMRSTDGGTSWDVIGLPGTYIRTLVGHPLDPDVLYVGTWKDGLYVTDTARADGATFVAVPGAPETVEEVAIVGEGVYVAAGMDGLFRLDESSWTRLEVGVPEGSDWATIAGLDLGSKPLLFAGCVDCAPAEDGHLATVIRSTDGGSSWQNVTGPDDLDFDVVGSGERWLMADGVPDYMPGARDAIVSQFALKEVAAPGGASEPQVLVLWAGRGGLWRSIDAGATWAPAVDGLSEANSEGLAIEPSDPERVVQGAAHFGLQASDDGFRTVHVDAFLELPPLAGHSHPAALRTAFDPTTDPATVIVAAADAEDARVGGVFETIDPWSRDAWVDLGFTEAMPKHQPTSVAVGSDDGGRRIILAVAQPKGGLVRRVGEGPWQHVEGTDAFTKASRQKSELLWITGTSLIYAYDLGRGIYRSSDRGLSFELIWEHPSTALGTGAIAASTEDPSTLYVAAEDGLYRLEGAVSASAGSSGAGSSEVGSLETGEPGALVVSRLDPRTMADVVVRPDGAVWAVAHPTADAPTTVLFLPEPGADPSVIHEYTDDLLANTMVVPETMVVMEDGTVLVGGSRSGTLRGIPEW
jgi:hypothetical protein